MKYPNHKKEAISLPPKWYELEQVQLPLDRIKYYFYGVRRRFSYSIGQLYEHYKFLCDTYIKIVFTHEIDMDFTSYMQRNIVCHISFMHRLKRYDKFIYNPGMYELRLWQSRMFRLRRVVSERANEDMVRSCFMEAIYVIACKYHPHRITERLIRNKLLQYTTLVLLQHVYDNPDFTMSTYKSIYYDMYLRFRYYNKLDSLSYEDNYEDPSITGNYIADEDELGTNWLNGDCCEELASMSAYERYVLKLAYLLPYADVAPLAGLSTHGVFYTLNVTLKECYKKTAPLKKCIKCGDTFYHNMSNVRQFCCSCRKLFPSDTNTLERIRKNLHYNPELSKKYFIDPDDSYDW